MMSTKLEFNSYCNQVSSSASTIHSKIKDSASAEEMILAWFERHNKPVTAQSLTDALGSRISKLLIQKILEEKVRESILTVKDFKKVRFYFYRSTDLKVDETNQLSCEECIEDKQNKMIVGFSQERLDLENDIREESVNDDMSTKQNEKDKIELLVNDEIINTTSEMVYIAETPIIMTEIMCLREMILSEENEYFKLQKMESLLSRSCKILEMQNEIEMISMDVNKLINYVKDNVTFMDSQNGKDRNKDLLELSNINQKVHLVSHNRKELANMLLTNVSTNFTSVSDVIDALNLRVDTEATINDAIIIKTVTLTLPKK